MWNILYLVYLDQRLVQGTVPLFQSLLVQRPSWLQFHQTCTSCCDTARR